MSTPARIDIIVVYKIDRLTRSLTDFAKLNDVLDQHQVSFVAVTQQFNTSTSMGRLTLNVLLSFAQFEREVAGERIRDKVAASKKKGMWMGGPVPLGYAVKERKLVIVPKRPRSSATCSRGTLNSARFICCNASAATGCPITAPSTEGWAYTGRHGARPRRHQPHAEEPALHRTGPPCR